MVSRYVWLFCWLFCEQPVPGVRYGHLPALIWKNKAGVAFFLESMETWQHDYSCCPKFKLRNKIFQELPSWASKVLTETCHLVTWLTRVAKDAVRVWRNVEPDVFDGELNLQRHLYLQPHRSLLVNHYRCLLRYCICTVNQLYVYWICDVLNPWRILCLFHYNYHSCLILRTWLHYCVCDKTDVIARLGTDAVSAVSVTITPTTNTAAIDAVCRQCECLWPFPVPA